MVGGAFITCAPVPVGAGAGPFGRLVVGCTGGCGFGLIVLVDSAGRIAQDAV